MDPTSAKDQAEAALYTRIADLAPEASADEIWTLACSFARVQDGYREQEDEDVPTE